MCKELSTVGFHGDMAQERRSSILQGLLEGKYSVVVATGVLARGLDLLHVRQVLLARQVLYVSSQAWSEPTGIYL